MEFDLALLPPGDGYRLLSGVVVPRPIAFVTTVDAEGRVNAAPYSFFNLLGSDPPLVGIGIGDRPGGAPKDTVRNIAQTGGFVVNLVDEALAERMNIAAVDFPPGVSELVQAGLTPAPSAKVAAPRVAESPVHLECRHVETRRIGNNNVVLGEVVHLHVRDGLVAAGSDRPVVDTPALHLIGRMHGGGWYVRTSDRFDLERITLADWERSNK